MIDQPTDTAASRKAVLREAALARRDALEIDDRLIWDEAIAQRALALLTETVSSLRAERSNPEPRAPRPPGLLRSARNDGEGAAIVSGYWPMRSEADPRPIMEGLHERGLQLCLPAIVDKRMIFRRWAPYEPIVPGGFGTLVPAPHQPEIAPTILLVPLAAFDRRGCRIGYGKGYYDGKLTELGNVTSIGLAYGAQEIGAAPDEAHDRRLDWVVTERETIRCG